MSTGIGWPRTPSTGPPTSGSSPGRWGWSGRRRTPTGTVRWSGCPRRWCGGFPSAPARSTRPSRNWLRTVGSGRRGNDHPVHIPGGLAVATQQANRASDRERELRQHQQRRQGWLEANAHLGPAYRQMVRTLAWQRRATGLAVEQDRSAYIRQALGPVPKSTRGRWAWRHAAAEVEQYRRSYHITDPERALGPEPQDPAQRADHQRARMAIERVHTKQRTTDRTHERQPPSEHTTQPRPRRPRGRQG